MSSLPQDNGFPLDCTVSSAADGYCLTGTFQYLLPFADAANELNHIERPIEQIGQEFQRQPCR